MHALRSLVLTGGLLVGLASQVPAQLNINLGNPLNGQAFATTVRGPGYSTLGGVGGTSYGYSSGYSGYSNYGGVAPGIGGYNNYSGYSSTGYLSGPGVIGQTYGYPGVGNYGYSSGYSGVAVNPYGYQNRPYYGAYGYGNYSNGSIDGFRPFRTLNRNRRF